MTKRNLGPSNAILIILDFSFSCFYASQIFILLVKVVFYHLGLLLVKVVYDHLGLGLFLVKVAYDHLGLLLV